MSELIVAIAGQPNVGKTTAVRYLGNEQGFTVVDPPKILKAYADEHNLTLVRREDWAHVRQIIGEEQGEGWLADYAISESAHNRVVIDGLSTVGDYEILMEKSAEGLAHVACVGLVCSPNEQHRREVERAAPGKEVASSVEEMLANQQKESVSPARFGMARQAVLNFINDDMTISTDNKTSNDVHQELWSLLVNRGFTA